LTELQDRLSAALADRYVLERELGHGGMATVYLARDLKHKRPVALKVLRPELAATLGPDRFRREIETAARLQHPHICTVYDSGEAAGRLWFTMPYVAGETLRDRLGREGRLKVAEALRITTEAGRALDYAHRQGVIHRDMKPENILLTADGDTLVADFGIARALATLTVETREPHLTETGIALGTPAYMAPEQATGERGVDARADQYSLATTCYEMLVGQTPFTGPTPSAVVAQRFREPAPSARAGRPEVPSAVDEALHRALALDPAERFASLAEFLTALNRSAPPTLPASGPRPRVRLSLLALVTGALLAAGALSLGRWSTAPDDQLGRRLAVLPFENRGDSADAYFADGITDEVRGKLTTISGLEVIASGSSNQYRRSTKPPEQIARELGVRWLLTGTVRWDKADGGISGSRVRVSPELVEVVADRAPASKWQQPFEASLTDVFQVQADIAGQVASALGLVLGDSMRQALVVRPTENFEAYDAFLRGEAHLVTATPKAYREAIREYERAVALDSGFAVAWAHLSRARSAHYAFVTPIPELETGARQAAERATALAPTRVEPWVALADYWSVVRPDNARTLEALERAVQLAPDHPAVLALVARTDARLGRWEAARIRLARSADLDPRSAVAWRRYGMALLLMRRYNQARTALGRAVMLAPTNLGLLEQQAVLALAQGNTAAAHAILRSPPTGVDPLELAAFFGHTLDLYWLLDDEQQRSVLALTLAASGWDRASWAGIRAQIYYHRGDSVLMRAWADTARIEFDRQIRDAPEGAQLHVFRGLHKAYLGRHEEAIADGERAVTLVPIGRDAFLGPYIQHQLVRIYLVVGHHERALDRLEPLLRVPYHLSPAWLRIDPNFAPLRGYPRFQRLLAAGE
jgi:eukaryotic-like serine/threonine-protein kinase